MNKNAQEHDLLKDLFRRMPEEELPSGFKERMMEKVCAEAVKIKKRNERLTLLSVILASIVILSLAVLSLIFLEIPRITLSLSALASVPFYLYIGILALLLLFADYKLRRNYMKRHSHS